MVIINRVSYSLSCHTTYHGCADVDVGERQTELPQAMSPPRTSSPPSPSWAELELNIGKREDNFCNTNPCKVPVTPDNVYFFRTQWWAGKAKSRHYSAATKKPLLRAYLFLLAYSHVVSHVVRCSPRSICLHASTSCNWCVLHQRHVSITLASCQCDQPQDGSVSPSVCGNDQTTACFLIFWQSLTQHKFYNFYLVPFFSCEQQQH